MTKQTPYAPPGAEANPSEVSWAEVQKWINIGDHLKGTGDSENKIVTRKLYEQTATGVDTYKILHVDHSDATGDPAQISWAEVQQLINIGDYLKFAGYPEGIMIDKLYEQTGTDTYEIKLTRKTLNATPDAKAVTANIGWAEVQKLINIGDHLKGTGDSVGKVITRKLYNQTGTDTYEILHVDHPDATGDPAQISWEETLKLINIGDHLKFIAGSTEIIIGRKDYIQTGLDTYKIETRIS